MNKKLLRTLLGACLIAGVFDAECETGNMPYPLTYNAAIQLALANRTELAIAQANIQITQARIEEAKGAFLPSLDAFSTVQRIKSYQVFSGVNINASFNGVNIPVDVKSFIPPYQISSGLELNYKLYSGGAMEARVNDALATKLGAEGQQALSRKIVILDITTAYWGLHKAQITYRAAERNLDFAREESAAFIKKFNQGLIAQIDLNAKILAIQTREMGLRNASRSLLDCQRRYNYSLGLDTTTKPDTKSHMLSDQPSNIEIERLLVDFGLIREPEMVIAKADFGSAKAHVDQARADYKPVVDLFAIYKGIGRSNNNFGDASTGYGRDNVSVGVRLKWNLFDGFRTTSRVTQAVAESEQMRLKIEQTRREINNDWQEKQSREADMRDQLLLANKHLELAQAQLKIAKKRWETKLISTLQYREVQLMAEEASDKAASVDIDLLIARVASQLAQNSTFDSIP